MNAPRMAPKSRYGSFRAKLLVRIFAAKPSPRQVAECLESNRARYPQIRQDEIDRYRLWGEEWPGGPAPTGPLEAQDWAQSPEVQFPEG